MTWLARGGRLPDREAAPAPSPGLGAKVFVGALAATLLGCIVLRVEAWPFTDYRVFQKRKAAGSAWTLRLAIVPEQGQPRWLERDEGALSPRALKRRARFAFRAETTDALRDVLRNEVRWVVGGSRATGELRLYLRQARPDPEAEGGFVFLDTPLYGLPIAAEDGELVIYCDYVRERGRCRNNPPVRIAAPWRHPGPRVH